MASWRYDTKAKRRRGAALQKSLPRKAAAAKNGVDQKRTSGGPAKASALQLALASRRRSPQTVVDDVEITEHRQNESVMDAHGIRNSALHNGQDCAANDCHVQNAGATSRQRAKPGDTQAENRGKHDGVEHTNGKDAPHRRVSVR